MIVLTPRPLGLLDSDEVVRRPGPLGADGVVARGQSPEWAKSHRRRPSSDAEDEDLKKRPPGAVELRLITFIPMERISDPLGVQYQADGAGFSYSRSEYRTRHTLIIDPSKLREIDRAQPRASGATSIDPGFVIKDERETGLSISYVPNVFLPGGRMPIMGGEVQRDTADAPSSVDWRIQRTNGRNFKLTMRVNATNPVAATHLLGIVPAINYEIDFLFETNGSVTVNGEHDGFPAYDFYFQQHRFHHYDPIASGRSPLSLFGPATNIRLGARKLR